MTNALKTHLKSNLLNNCMAVGRGCRELQRLSISQTYYAHHQNAHHQNVHHRFRPPGDLWNTTRAWPLFCHCLKPPIPSYPRVFQHLHSFTQRIWQCHQQAGICHPSLAYAALTGSQSITVTEQLQKGEETLFCNATFQHRLFSSKKVQKVSVDSLQPVVMVQNLTYQPEHRVTQLLSI